MTKIKYIEYEIQGHKVVTADQYGAFKQSKKKRRLNAERRKNTLRRKGTKISLPKV